MEELTPTQTEKVEQMLDSVVSPLQTEGILVYRCSAHSMQLLLGELLKLPRLANFKKQLGLLINFYCERKHSAWLNYFCDPEEATLMAKAAYDARPTPNKKSPLIHENDCPLWLSRRGTACQDCTASSSNLCRMTGC